MNILKDTIIKLVNDFEIKSTNESGQNFLVDEELLEKEVENATLKETDVVLDIGAGFGSIETRVRRICKIIAIEKEIKCYSYLVDKYEIDNNVQVINADALDMIYPRFTKVISNPPYNITDRIIEKLSHYDFESGVMILPKTIADELIAEDPKTVFSAFQKVFMDFSKITDVPKYAFYPEPRVTSTMVNIKRRPHEILQGIFKRREMTFKNAVSNSFTEVKTSTKKQSKEFFSSFPVELKVMENKPVKTLSLEDVKKIIAYFK